MLSGLVRVSAPRISLAHQTEAFSFKPLQNTSSISLLLTKLLLITKVTTQGRIIKFLAANQKSTQNKIGGDSGKPKRTKSLCHGEGEGGVESCDPRLHNSEGGGGWRPLSGSLPSLRAPQFEFPQRDMVTSPRRPFRGMFRRLGPPGFPVQAALTFAP